MTVKELIQNLSQFNENQLVVIEITPTKMTSIVTPARIYEVEYRKLNSVTRLCVLLEGVII